MADPEKFQHYEVQKRADGSLFELGRGAMGVTYKAFDTNLRVYVALKVINNAYLDSEVARQRFLREARAAAALQHANVASVFHLGNDADCFFYAMEFVDGETVDARLRREGPIPVAQSLEIALQVTKALIAAEKQKLVHRDLKPANIMLQKEDAGDIAVKVIDFGLAKATEKEASDATLTQGGFLGTPHFASPEQLEEREVDIRSDIYSLGVTLWCMLLGKTPYSGSLAQVMSQHLYKPVPVEQLVGFPPEVIALLRHMLEKDPAKRPQTPMELRREIEGVMQRLPASAGSVAGGAVSMGDDNFETLATMAGGGSTPVPPPPPVIGQTPPPIPLPPPPLESMHLPQEQSEPVKVSKPPLLIPLLIVGLVLGVIATGIFFVVTRLKPKTVTIELTTKETPTPPPTTVAEVTPSPTPVPTPTPDPDGPYKQSLAAGTALADAGKWPEALSALTALARLYPDKPEPKQRLEGICARFIRDDSPMESAAFEEIHVPLEDAADLGLTRALVLLAQNIRKNDPDRAISLFERAATAGDVSAMRQGGLIYSNRNLPGDMTRAVTWFEQGARLGDSACNYLAGESYLLGKGVARDVEKGVAYLEQAAAQDDPRALDRLGDYYYKAAKDYPKALAAFEKARRLDWVPALANLGVLYINGDGVAKDETGAAALFKEGAEKGDSRAMLFYAQCLEGGVGVSANRPQAVKWYQEAAAKGEPRAVAWLQKNKP